MRPDHWIKQMFIIPGCVCAVFLINIRINFLKFIAGFLATCFIASANYVINEYLDAEFDKYHPVKKNRSLVNQDVSGKIIFILWLALALAGFILGKFLNAPFLISEFILWIMGIVYNVKPLRTKDVAILDVLSESINNAIRFLMGWFIVSPDTLPPCSIILGYWMGGAFLMAVKRYAEYRMINNPELAGKYRRSFKFYSERSLLLSAFFYAMCSVFFTGIFLIKYRIELVLIIPVLTGLFCYYFYLSFKDDSAVQKPEKLYHEKGLMFYCAVLIISFTILMFIDIPVLKIFTGSELMQLK